MECCAVCQLMYTRRLLYISPTMASPVTVSPGPGQVLGNVRLLLPDKDYLLGADTLLHSSQRWGWDSGSCVAESCLLPMIGRNSCQGPYQLHFASYFSQSVNNLDYSPTQRAVFLEQTNNGHI